MSKSPFWNDAFWDAAEKRYHDGLAESPVARFSFANSDDSFERAFFYAELGHQLGIGLLPRPYKDGTLVDIIARSYTEISGCDACSADAEKNPHCILADVMNRPGMVEFILSAPVQCPTCHGPVTEKTLVDRVGGIEVSV
jgi:hypothetical protein